MDCGMVNRGASAAGSFGVIATLFSLAPAAAYNEASIDAKFLFRARDSEAPGYTHSRNYFRINDFFFPSLSGERLSSKETTMKQSNVVKCLALVCALSMPLAAFAASPGTGGAGAAGTGAAGTGGASTGAPGTGTAGTGGGPGPGTGAGNSTNPAAAAEPLQPTPPDKPTGIK
jgi:hypothetical protein